MLSRTVVLLTVAALVGCGTSSDDRMSHDAAVGAGATPTSVTTADLSSAIAPPPNDAAGPGDAGPAVEPAAVEPTAAEPVAARPADRAPLRISRLDPAPPPITPAAPPSPPPAAAPPAAEPPRYTDDDVRVVQEMLQEQGLYLGPLDGTLGPETQRALARYQRRLGLRETAQLDLETLRRLDLGPGDGPRYGAAGTDDRPAAGTGEPRR